MGEMILGLISKMMLDCDFNVETLPEWGEPAPLRSHGQTSVDNE